MREGLPAGEADGMFRRLQEEVRQGFAMVYAAACFSSSVCFVTPAADILYIYIYMRTALIISADGRVAPRQVLRNPAGLDEALGDVPRVAQVAVVAVQGGGSWGIGGIDGAGDGEGEWGVGGGAEVSGGGGTGERA